MIHLRPPRRREGTPIVALANRIFGDGYLSLKEIDERFLVLRVDGAFAGFVNTEIWDAEEETDTDGSLGLISTIALDSEYRGYGLGTVLVGAATASLIHEGVDSIECYATTWSDSGICYSKGALERNGFTVSEHFPKLWSGQSIEYTCAACGKPPCVCDATLYVKEVNTA